MGTSADWNSLRAPESSQMQSLILWRLQVLTAPVATYHQMPALSAEDHADRVQNQESGARGRIQAQDLKERVAGQGFTYQHNSVHYAVETTPQFYES